MPDAPIRTRQRRTPVVVCGTNFDEDAAFHVSATQVELPPGQLLAAADLALIAADAIESICFGQGSW